jgi:hypothetical protein
MDGFLDFVPNILELSGPMIDVGNVLASKRLGRGACAIRPGLTERCEQYEIFVRGVNRVTG